MSYFPVLAFQLPTLDGLEKVVVFLLMLSVLVVLHEAGHFVVARLNGVRVNDFAVGFGPTLLKWTSPRTGTNYRLNLLPIGGYCAMQGEDGKTNEAEQQRDFREKHVLAPDNFQAKSTWQRLAIIVAGPIANFILAFVILWVAALTFGVPNGEVTTTVQQIRAGLPAQAAGIHSGDKIVAIDGVPYGDGNKLVTKIHSSLGKSLRVTYQRGGERRTVTITPVANKFGHETLGVLGFTPVPVYQSVGPIEATQLAALNVWAITAGTYSGLMNLVIHPQVGIAQMSGPIGMGRAAGVVQDFGWAPYLSLAAMISVALGFFNLLPLPALDGGRGIFIIAEMLRGKPVDPEREAIVHFAGFAVLMALMLFVAYHDVANIVTGKPVF